MIAYLAYETLAEDSMGTHVPARPKGGPQLHVGSGLPLDTFRLFPMLKVPLYTFDESA